VWKLERLGRSLRHLIDVCEDLRTRGVEFRCLTQPIDTTTAAGRCFYQELGAFAEFEHALIVERTVAGLDAARARGYLTAGSDGSSAASSTVCRRAWRP
jgi:DNA invertase Pin-like site-specific DNA recombinase